MLGQSEKQYGWPAELRALLALAWPIILTNLTMTAINVTDVLLLGRLGKEELAASALGTSIVFALLLFGIGVVVASSPLMAAEIGRMPHAVREIRRSFRQALWLATAITLPLWILLWFLEPLLLSAGQPAQLAADTALFVRGYMWMIWPALGITAFRCFFSALERPGWPLIVGIATVIANAILGYAFIFGKLGAPALGLFGSGIAGTITNCIGFLALVGIAFYHPRYRRYRLFGYWWQSDRVRLLEVWQLGFPIGMTMAFESFVFSAAVFLMGYISTTAVAAHSIAIQIAATSFMVPLGLGQAATVRVGQAFGRRDARGVAIAGRTAWITGVAFMAVMAVVILLFARQLASFVLDPATADGAEVIDLAVSFLAIAALFQVFDGAQVVGAGMLRGIQVTAAPMAYAAFGYWVVGIGVGSWLAFRQGWGGQGIWVGLAVGLAIVSILMLWRWHRRGVIA